MKMRQDTRKMTSVGASSYFPGLVLPAIPSLHRLEPELNEYEDLQSKGQPELTPAYLPGFLNTSRQLRR